ncbi:MAG: Ribonuclease HIII [Chlamydiia bacterium]|nr:Ribonuclease HIII [Chlamydiia bacterium]
MSHCFVTQIDPSYAEKIEIDLIEKGFTITTPPYTLFAAKKPGVSCCFYTSGKFTVQGKDKDDFIIFYLEPEVLKNFNYSNPKTAIDQTARIGCDEAGKGDFFGPLCCASFYFDPAQLDFLLDLKVNDSKTINDKKIAQIAQKLKANCNYEIVTIFPKKYNELYSKFQNLNVLLGWAHIKAMSQLSDQVQCNDVLLDQFAKPPFMQNLLNRSGYKHLNLTERTKAESDVAVACASILARDAFVTGMDKLSSEFEMEIPKGASQRVISAGKKFLSRHGRGNLELVSKMHFKTYKDLFV